MAIFLLDSTVIIDALNNKRGRAAFLVGLLNEGHSLACTPINVTEVYAGMRPAEEEATVRFLSSLQLFPLTRTIAERAGLLKRDFGKRGTTLNLGDVLIAATALENRIPLLTDNVKDFPIQELNLYPLPRA